MNPRTAQITSEVRADMARSVGETVANLIAAGHDVAHVKVIFRDGMHVGYVSWPQDYPAALDEI
jgi:hypothetical protein